MNDPIPFLDTASAQEIDNLTELTVRINRSAAVVKGGRRFSFSSLCVAGNREGVVGYGYGKARQVPMAIEKGNKDARKHLLRVDMSKAGSISHEVTGRFCGSMVRLIPAGEGTGIIAGQAVRSVCEMAGIRNILSKVYGSTNPINVVKATFVALAQLRTPEQVASLRGGIELR
ncbi:30S ribosomal protein S5 [Planctomycetes bacterium Pla163]|uniref:Small ribosomal subunit protein uS5 n=1 Tax=Rohdeia mirabilis TaxID=2528008 RepID=A0A518D2T2_9BACT|nr:30S ribosomal protein S5 [Planctomycetes bacterium Pla163]